MARPATCPPELALCVFRGSDAVRSGLITRERLRHRMWVRLAEDVYVLGEHHDQPWARREALRLLTGPRQVACGLTAAWLHGLWTPRAGQCVPLELSRPPSTNGQAVQGHQRRRLTLSSATSTSTQLPDVVQVDGVTVTSHMRTCFDLMRDRQLVEAIVVADAFLYQGAVDPVALALYLQERVRWPGVRRARLAAALASPFARSAGESRLRAILVLAGFEAPMVNVPVIDARGQLIATPDLQVRGRHWAWLEYDGAYHETGDQHRADVRRENRLAVASSGIPLLRYDRGHVGTRTGRERVVDEVGRAIGARAAVALRHEDFARPERRAW